MDAKLRFSVCGCDSPGRRHAQRLVQFPTEQLLFERGFAGVLCSYAPFDSISHVMMWCSCDDVMLAGAMALGALPNRAHSFLAHTFRFVDRSSGTPVALLLSGCVVLIQYELSYVISAEERASGVPPEMTCVSCSLQV